MTATYNINDRDLRDLGVHVTHSEGWRGLPKPKAPKTETWDDLNGAYIFGNRHTLAEARTIKLQLIIVPTENATLGENILFLKQALTSRGNAQVYLRIDDEWGVRHNFTTIRTEALEIKPIDAGQCATSTLVLIEYKDL